MTAFRRIIYPGVLLLLAAGCAQPWPDNIPARTYTGMVIDGPLHAPAAGARVEAVRGPFKPGGIAIGIFEEAVEIGHATTDAKGRFTLRTKTGYALSLNAETADGHLLGAVAVKPDETGGLRITADQPAYGSIVYDPGADPTLKLFKTTGSAVQQIIRYLAAHPREPRRSLGDYASRGVISPEALAAFSQNPEDFFGPSPRVKYGWGKDVLVFPDARKPITLRRGRLGFDPVL